MEMAPGERCEIIVDLADGQTAKLLTIFEDEYEADGLVESVLELFGLFSPPLPAPSLILHVDRALPAHTAELPGRLNTIGRPLESEITTTRDFLLEMEGAHGSASGHHGMDMTINGVAMDMETINERIKRGL